MIVVATVCALALLFSPLSWRARGLAFGTLVVVPLAAAGWFYIRNLAEFGAVFPGEQLGPPLSLTNPVYRGVFQSALQTSYWYTGGWMNVDVVRSMYQFLDIVSGMALGGMIVIAVRNKLTVLQQRGLVLLTVLLALAFFEVIWISTRISFQPQGRFLFIAQSAIALMLALGISALFQRDTQRDHVAAVLLPVVLLGLNLGILTLTLPTVY